MPVLWSWKLLGNKTNAILTIPDKSWRCAILLAHHLEERVLQWPSVLRILSGHLPSEIPLSFETCHFGDRHRQTLGRSANRGPVQREMDTTRWAEVGVPFLPAVVRGEPLHTAAVAGVTTLNG